MSKTTHVIGVLVLLAVGLGLANAYAKFSSRSPARETASRERLLQTGESDPRLVQQVLELSAEVAALRARALEARPTTTAADAGSPGGATVVRTAAEERQERQEHIADVEASFHQERPDPAWARETAAVIRRDAAEFPAIASALRSYDCRSESCRVELGPTDSEDVTRELPLFFHHLASRLPTIQFDQVDWGGGKKGLVAYLSRDSESTATNGPTLE